MRSGSRRRLARSLPRSEWRLASCPEFFADGVAEVEHSVLFLLLEDFSLEKRVHRGLKDGDAIENVKAGHLLALV